STPASRSLTNPALDLSGLSGYFTDLLPFLCQRGCDSSADPNRNSLERPWDLRHIRVTILRTWIIGFWRTRTWRRLVQDLRVLTFFDGFVQMSFWQVSRFTARNS